MIRDDKMMQLVASEKEPITPFVRKVRSLYNELGVSSILVIGGSGDYFDVADNVIMMDCYKCLDVTERAKQIVANSSTSGAHQSSASVPFGAVTPRYAHGNAFNANGKVAVRSKETISYGEVGDLDLSALEQLVSKPQTSAVSAGLQTFAKLAGNGSVTLSDALVGLEKAIDQGGLDALAPGQFNGGLARPRAFEIAGAINRLRTTGGLVQSQNRNANGLTHV